jgi:hypothetical protein
MKQDYFEMDRVIGDLAKSYAAPWPLVGLRLAISKNFRSKSIGKK